MHKLSGAVSRPAVRTARGVILSGVLIALCGLAVPTTAQAQFFWDSPRYSADDIARSVMERGFRPLARPVRNDNVYVADVVDRSGRRERLIVSAESGQILQRFAVEYGRRFRRDVDPSIPRGPMPPAPIPNEDSQPSIFSRLFGGNDQPEAVPQRPFGGDGDMSLPQPAHPRPARPRRQAPRVVERSPETVQPTTPIESAPLAPANTAPATTATVPAAKPPSPTATAPSDRPVRSIVTNPLSLPGTREQDEASGRPAAKPATASAAPVAPAPAEPAKASAAKPPVKDVPVAPLD